MAEERVYLLLAIVALRIVGELQNQGVLCEHPYLYGVSLRLGSLI